MSSSRLRFGVLGAADIGLRRTIPALIADPDIDVTAIASRDAAKAARFAERFGCEAVTGYDALLSRDDIDAVYIPVPVMLHTEWVEAALLRGKHVLVEKPLAATRSRTEELIDLARSRGLVLMENFTSLHHVQHAAVMKQLGEGAIGELRSLSAAFTIPPKAEGDIRYQPDVGGGALLDIGIYPLRAALHILGPELEVVGAVLRHERRRDVVLSGHVLLTTPQGVVADLAFGMEHAYRAEYTLYGTTGRLRLDRAFTPPETHLPRLEITRQDTNEVLTLPADAQFANLVREFAPSARRDPGRLARHHADAVLQADLVERVMDAARVYPC
ncbi:Gfo/Idh/MocA family oxidoreductase [Streptomyces sp. NPDC005900]|uniref:Gfo/Idh/MocA family protein n=1 Tax=Streptomyces sp. NPDC005900 TaxID=3154569 RepID=UPI0033C1741B